MNINFQVDIRNVHGRQDIGLAKRLMFSVIYY